jgi:hypothetical protein
MAPSRKHAEPTTKAADTCQSARPGAHQWVAATIGVGGSSVGVMVGPASWSEPPNGTGSQVGNDLVVPLSSRFGGTGAR